MQGKSRIIIFSEIRKKSYFTYFHVQSKVRATSKQEAERVGKYMIRPILSLKRLSFDEAQGQVIYQYGKHSSKLERPPPPQIVQHELLMAVEEMGEYF